MKETDMNQYRALLLAKRAEIMSKSRQREDICIVQSSEQIESIQLAGERDVAVRTMERESKSLMQIREALKRIDDGEFGICLECEEPITPKRLAAVPWAAYCLHCQELHDSQEKADGFEPMLAA